MESYIRCEVESLTRWRHIRPMCLLSACEPDRFVQLCSPSVLLRSLDATILQYEVDWVNRCWWGFWWKVAALRHRSPRQSPAAALHRLSPYVRVSERSAAADVVLVSVNGWGARLGDWLLLKSEEQVPHETLVERWWIIYFASSVSKLTIHSFQIIDFSVTNDYEIEDLRIF